MPRVPEQEKFELTRVGVIARINEDVRTVTESDPAARSYIEVLLCYPGLHALWFHRLAYALWWRGFKLLGRIVSHISRHCTGIEIHPGAKIGRRVFIDHGMGVVIGETATVEDDVLIYKGVVLGGTTCERKIRHPYIKRGTVVGSNACILGAIVIGENSRIGSGSVVIHDVPDSATVVGVPGRIVITHEPNKPHNLLHGDLPDPVARALDALMIRLSDVQKRLSKVEGKCEIEPAHDQMAPLEDLQSIFSDPNMHQDGSGI